VQRKQARYVQTAEEMTKQLVELGLQNTSLKFADGQTADGETLRIIVQHIAELEEPLLTLERRGIDLRLLASRHLTDRGLLPRYRVFLGREQHWFADKPALDKFVAEQEAILGHELRIADENPAAVPATDAAAADPTSRNGHDSLLQIVDLHENRAINHLLSQLAGYGIKIRDLLSAGTKDGLAIHPFTLLSDNEQVPLSSLRDLVTEIRKLGEHGLKLTRFKGLGEMNSDELGETAMDKKSRTLLQVTMQDATAADEIFRVLMGDHVEPRREFIEKHALEVKELDV
jgi:DNA gyrase subunit B